MRSLVKVYGRLERCNPILVEGLPGIGFVSNILALHLISTVKARLLCEFRSPYFQDLSLVEDGGVVKPASVQLYLGEVEGRSLLVLYGNSQASTPYGQHELCTRILEVAGRMGCRVAVCMGGYATGRPVGEAEVYGTAVSLEWMRRLESAGVKPMTGRIYGVAGLLMVLAPRWGIDGVCLLAETPGNYPDPKASRSLLEKFNRIFGFHISLEGLDRISKYIAPGGGSF